MVLFVNLALHFIYLKIYMPFCSCLFAIIPAFYMHTFSVFIYCNSILKSIVIHNFKPKKLAHKPKEQSVTEDQFRMEGWRDGGREG